MTPLALTAASAVLAAWLLAWTYGIAGSPRPRTGERHVSFAEATIILVVLAAMVALGIWFFFFASGGIGLGSV